MEQYDNDFTMIVVGREHHHAAMAVANLKALFRVATTRLFGSCDAIVLCHELWTIKTVAAAVFLFGAIRIKFSRIHC